jgi:hypothetical protein
VVGTAVLVTSTASTLFHHVSWTGRLITSVEGILLFLIPPVDTLAAAGAFGVAGALGTLLSTSGH